MKGKSNFSDLILHTTASLSANEKYVHPYFDPIRMSIFYITAVCVGLLCLIWAFYFVHLQRKTRGRISAFIILLLLSDFMQLPLYPYIVSRLFYFPFSPGIDTIIVDFIYFYLKVCSLHLQHLVVLEWVLTLKYPQVSAHIFTSPCYILISITVLLFPLMCAILLLFSRFTGESLGFDSVVAPVCLLVVTGTITYRAPPTPAGSPATDSRPVFLLTTATTVVLYLPYVLFHFVQILLFGISGTRHIPVSVDTMSRCLLSLTVISEPLLCVLVCRENLSTATKQTHVELSSEQTAV